MTHPDREGRLMLRRLVRAWRRATRPTLRELYELRAYAYGEVFREDGGAQMTEPGLSAQRGRVEAMLARWVAEGRTPREIAEAGGKQAVHRTVSSSGAMGWVP